MDEKQLSDYVVKELAQEVDKDDVIFTVCQKSEMNWPEAEDFVNRVEVYQQPKIKKRRAPLLILLCSVVIITGVVQSITSVEPILDNIRQISRITGGLNLLRALFEVGTSLPYFMLGLISLSSGIIGLYTALNKDS
jgi:hypothetical protein